MKSIEKGQPPKFLIDYCYLQEQAGLEIKYKNFNAINELRAVLGEQQGYLCCYCMQRIDADSSRIEHFLPQQRFEEEQLTYSNLFIACNSSHGFAPDLQHCDIKKGELLIPKYISDPKCSDYFQYNSVGEILPYGNFKKYEDYCQNFVKLNPEQKAILSTIALLNLNVASLKVQRMAVFSTLATKIRGLKKEQLQKKIEEYQKLVLDAETNQMKLRPFCGVAVYVLKDYLRRKFR